LISLTRRLTPDLTYKLFLDEVRRIKTAKEFLAKAPYTSVKYREGIYHGPIDSKGLRNGVGLIIFGHD
jgi:hypothetical protein